MGNPGYRSIPRKPWIQEYIQETLDTGVYIGNPGYRSIHRKPWIQEYT